MSPTILPPELSKYYHLDRLLGTGTYSQVWRAVSLRHKCVVAIKIVPFSKLAADRLVFDTLPNGKTIILPMEVYLLRRLKHPNIISLLDYASDSSFCYIITEYFGSPVTKESFASLSNTANLPLVTDLFDAIQQRPKSFSEPTILCILKQLVSTLLYLKSMNVYHMDIKCENILIDSAYRIKLVDFGSARIISKPSRPESNFYGTLAYGPPEIFTKSSYLPEKADVWSMGVTVHSLLYGHLPCEDPPTGPPRIPSLEFQRLLEDMLDENSDSRLTFVEVDKRAQELTL